MNPFSKYSINMPNILFPQDNGVGICSNDSNFTKNISRKYIPQLIKEANRKGGEDVWFYLFHYKSDTKLPFGVALESMRIGMAAKLPTMGDNWLIIVALWMKKRKKTEKLGWDVKKKEEKEMIGFSSFSPLARKFVKVCAPASLRESDMP